MFKFIRIIVNAINIKDIRMTDFSAIALVG